MLVMQRLQADVPVGISWQNIKFKPQTLYKLTLVGFGKDGALARLKHHEIGSCSLKAICGFPKSVVTRLRVLCRAEAGFNKSAELAARRHRKPEKPYLLFPWFPLETSSPSR